MFERSKNILNKLSTSDNLNTIYEKEFNKNKYGMSEVSGASSQDIDTYTFRMIPRSITKCSTLDTYNELAIRKLDITSKTHGACSMLSTMLLEAFSILHNQDIAFLTVGRISNDESKNIFFTPDRETVIKKMKEDQQNYSKTLLGGNIHVWITLGNGMIIDPSISMTHHGKNKVVAGFPEDLKDKYKYQPYLVVDFKDLTLINKQYENKDYAAKQMMNEKLEHMEIIRKNIDGYY
ncbi:MAG: hypothetical protein DRG78_05970 [Epsilonproteobacteria bacterium]|nr:MAG: hypothetical protein DRG78_05970 [Campylobacterota bacterium]